MQKIKYFLFLLLFANILTIFGVNHPNSHVLSQLQANLPTYPIRLFVFGDNRDSCTTCTDGDIIFMQLIDDIDSGQIPCTLSISNGDLVLSGYDFQYQNYMSMIDKASFPIFSVRGNHELYADDGPANFQKYFGEKYFSFSYGPLYICLFPDCFQRAEMSSYGHKIDYSVRDEYLDNLTSDLTGLGSSIKYKFLFTHAPIQVAGGSHYGSYCVYQNSNTDQFRNLVEAYGFTGVGFGHWHDYDHFFYNGIHYVLTGGAGAPLYHDTSKDPYSPPDYGEFNHYAIYTMDEYGNSILQLVKVGTDSLPDNNYTIIVSSSVKDVSPTRIDSLRILSTNYKSIYNLSWVATGDDGIIGKATSYDLRYSEALIRTSSDFDNASIYEQNWIPAESGYLENKVVNNLNIDKELFLAIRAIDDEGNKSEISNNTHLIPESYIKKTYPNPFHPNEGGFLHIEFVPAITDDIDFSIYSVDGKMVYNDTKTGNIGETMTFYWDGLYEAENEDKTMGAGMYFYVITIGKKSLQGKFALIK